MSGGGAPGQKVQATAVHAVPEEGVLNVGCRYMGEAGAHGFEFGDRLTEKGLGERARLRGMVHRHAKERIRYTMGHLHLPELRRQQFARTQHGRHLADDGTQRAIRLEELQQNVGLDLCRQIWALLEEKAFIQTT